jgi:hypothetical protein
MTIVGATHMLGASHGSRGGWGHRFSALDSLRHHVQLLSISTVDLPSNCWRKQVIRDHFHPSQNRAPFSPGGRLARRNARTRNFPRRARRSALRHLAALLPRAGGLCAACPSALPHHAVSHVVLLCSPAPRWLDSSWRCPLPSPNLPAAHLVTDSPFVPEFGGEGGGARAVGSLDPWSISCTASPRQELVEVVVLVVVVHPSSMIAYEFQIQAFSLLISDSMNHLRHSPY